MENSANTLIQNDTKILEDFSKIPAITWPIGAALLLAAYGTIPVWVAVFVIAGIFFAKWQIEKAEALKEARARAASYANLCGPVLVYSLSPEEVVQDVQDRAAKWREQLRLSGNPYAEKIPVIPFPFQPMLYPIGQLSIGWNIYQKDVAERQHIENLKWYEHGCPAHLRGVFASAVLPAPKIETI